MNNYSQQFRQSLDELNAWLLQRPNLNPNDMRFYESIKNHLTEALEAEPQQVDRIVETILHMLVDSALDDIREGFLPTFLQIADAVQKKEKRKKKS